MLGVVYFNETLLKALPAARALTLLGLRNCDLKCDKYCIM